MQIRPFGKSTQAHSFEESLALLVDIPMAEDVLHVVDVSNHDETCGSHPYLKDITKTFLVDQQRLNE